MQIGMEILNMLSLNQSIFMEGEGARPLPSLEGYAGKGHCLLEAMRMRKNLTLLILQAL